METTETSNPQISQELNQKWLTGFIDSFLKSNTGNIQDVYATCYAQSGEEGAVFIQFDDGSDKYVPTENLSMEVTTDMKVQVTFMALSQILEQMPKLGEDLFNRMKGLADDERMLTIVPYNRFGNIVLSQIYKKDVTIGSVLEKGREAGSEKGAEEEKVL